ncbi:large subunit of alpha-aminoadipate reductase, partial [Teratosphaeriaceae sp. CCFEE 6253]
MPEAVDVDARTKTENQLAEIWGQCLHVKAESMPRETLFNDLGGNSIQAVQVIFKANRRWTGLNLGIDVMAAGQSDKPTLRSVAEYIDRALNPVALPLDVADGEKEETQTKL